MAAIEARRRRPPLGLSQKRVGDDSAGERALDRLLDPARGNRVDRQRCVAEPDRVGGDAVRREIGGRVDRADVTRRAGLEAVLHEARACEKVAETLRPTRPASTGTPSDRRRRACCRARSAAARPRTTPLPPPRSSAFRADSPRANRRRRRASRLRFSSGRPTRRRVRSPRRGNRPRASRRVPSASIVEPPSPAVAAPVDDSGGLADLDPEGADPFDEGESRRRRGRR